MQETQVNRNRKAAFGWTMFDWANSAYALVITTAIFPIYFDEISCSKEVALRIETDAAGVTNAIVPFMGMEMKSISLLSIAVSIAYLLIAIVSPVLGGIADYSGRKKRYMMFFTLLGSGACASMFFFTPDNYYLGFWMFVLAAIGYAGGTIFNDAFLPEITTPDKYDRMSARGFAMGYIGSILLLVFNLFMIQSPGTFFDLEGKTASILADNPGMSQEAALAGANSYFAGLASRISFLMVGIWWFGFSLITYLSLKDEKPAYQPVNVFSQGFKELKSVLGKLTANLPLKRFLLAFFFYNMALQTVMYLAASFGKVELKMEQGDLIVTLLVIQVVAIPGSFLFSFLSGKLGNYRALLVGVTVWIGVCVGAYFVSDATGYKVLGAVVGLLMGGMQALSRATYSKLVPDGHDNASFFSFYSITDKISVVIGTLSFGIISQYFGTRNSVLALISFFLVGAAILYMIHTNSRKANA